MAPKAVSVSKKAIEQYDTDHIMSREKKIITEELLREHKRAENLAKANLTCSVIDFALLLSRRPHDGANSAMKNTGLCYAK